MVEENPWKKKALELAQVIESVSQPPLQLATLTAVGEDTVEIGHTNGTAYVVHYDPRLKNDLKPGQTVRISPETMAVVDIQEDRQIHNMSTIKDILPDGRVKIDQQGREKVILSAQEGLKVGQNVLVDDSYSIVLQGLGNETQDFKVERVPEVPWSSIGGLEGTIESIRDTIELPTVHKDVYAQFPNKKLVKGFVLYGPPGCGKTMLGKAVAYNIAKKRQEVNGGELNGFFLYAAGSEFLQKYVGTGEEKVRELFGNARETSAKNGEPVVVFIDEADAILKARGSGISSDASESILNQFLVEMDGLNTYEDVKVVIATNREDMLDSAVVRPGRLDRKVYVPRPNQLAAAKIFEIYLNGIPLDGDIKQYAAHAAEAIFTEERPVAHIHFHDGSATTVHYDHIFSGASVPSIIGRSTDIAIKRAIQGEPAVMTLDDLTIGVEQEYQENKGLTNQITKYDLKDIAGEKSNQIVRLTPAYETQGD